MSTLSPAERNKLIGILGMLGSDFPGERANAGEMATKLIRERGLTWGDLVPPALPNARELPRQRQPTGEAAIAADLRFCSRYLQHLSAWEQAFVTSVSGRLKVSVKQGEILRQAADKLRSRGFA